MNGFKLLEYELGSPDWQAKVKASKFVDWPNYGKAPRGHIAMQGDHEGTLAFRNIRRSAEKGGPCEPAPPPRRPSRLYFGVSFITVPAP